MPIFLKELCAPAHHRPHLGVAQQAFAYISTRGIPATLEPGVGGYGIDQRFGEQKIMHGVLRGARDRRRALDHVRVAHRPFVGLLRTHRATDDERETRELELLRDELVLRAHVVTDAYMGKVGHTAGWRRVVRRAGETVADLIDDDDEVGLRIECTPLTDVYLLYDLVGAGVPGGNHDGVVLGGVELAESDVGQAAFPDGTAFFQL